MEAETRSRAHAESECLVLLANHSKWDLLGVSTIAAPSDADVGVAEAGRPDAARQTLAASGGELIVAQ